MSTAMIQEMMIQHPVISLVVASFLCFGFVLYTSNLTIAATESKGKTVTKTKSKAKKTPKAKKAPSRRKKSPLGARRSTRKRTAAKAHNISDVSGKSY